MTRLATLAGTVLGIGYLKPAPGTWGSLAALPLGYALHQLGGFPLMLLAIAALFILGLWATRVMTQGKTDHDPSEIVMDEVVGQLIAILPLSYPAWAHGIDILALWPGWITAFVLFRLFDITKPGPVGLADKRNDALGVMLDDVFAGLIAASGVLLAAGLAHGVLGI